MHRPLADEIRPLELDDVVGQKHILGPGGLLRRVIDSGNIPNMVFYGPSGTGKTTVANIIARDVYKRQADRQGRRCADEGADSRRAWRIRPQKAAKAVDFARGLGYNRLERG